uniref:Uncharacterized protein n=1 Tax=Tetradesmus obliquus TaxID=3088 RepID=A0A383V665_TETOB|eukprot:jgi/Sobl393_1/9725/SZX61095.1
MPRPAATLAVALLALLLIHGVASLPEPAEKTELRRLLALPLSSGAAADVGGEGARQLLIEASTTADSGPSRKLLGYWCSHGGHWYWCRGRRLSAVPLEAVGADGVMVGATKALLSTPVTGAAVVGEGKRQLLNAAVTPADSGSARKLLGYWCSYRGKWYWCSGRRMLPLPSAEGVTGGATKALLSTPATGVTGIGEGKRQLLNQAITTADSRSARKLSAWCTAYKRWWRC